MNRTPSFSSAAASGGVSGAAVVVLIWTLGLCHVDVPAEVATAIMVLLSPLAHFAALRIGIPTPPAAPAEAPKP